MIKKRSLLWDWTNTAHNPNSLSPITFTGPLISLSNWNTWTPPELASRAPFRPMVRTLEQLSGQDWTNILSSSQPIVHYFNEPERTGNTPKQAAEIWMEKFVPLRKEKGVKVVSPSCANHEKGQTWIAEFLTLVSDNPPDYLGLHYYGTKSEEAVQILQEMHDKYLDLPVIVSEIASISREYKEVVKFTAEMCNWMDEREWVVEYGWFGCMREVADGFVSLEAQLLDKDGGLKELMRRLMVEQPMKI